MDIKDTSFEKKGLQFGQCEPIRNFVGREYELLKIHESLQNNGKAIISQVATVTGLGGIGKSELSKYYAKRYENIYSNVIFIMAETQNSIEADFSKLADKLKISLKEKKIVNNEEVEDVRGFEDIAHDVFEQLLKIGNTLLIYDNVEEYDIIKRFIPNNNELKTIITSRKRDCVIGIDTEKVIDLSVLLEEDAIQLIKEDTNFYEESDENIKKLINMLQRFPLALKQAVGYISQQKQENGSDKYTILNYIEQFKYKSKIILNEGIDTNENTYRYTIMKTWEITRSKISNGGIIGELAIRILNCLAYYIPDEIEIVKTFGKMNIEYVDDAIKRLHSFSMINLNNGIISIHRLVQEVTRTNLIDDDAEQNTLEQVLNLHKSNNMDNSILNHATFTWEFVTKYPELMKKYYEISIYGTKKHTPLHLLVRSENANIDIINLLIENTKTFEKSVLERLNKMKQIPLHVAIFSKNLNLMKLLLEKGSDINARDINEKTIIHYAALYGDKYMLEWLINMKVCIEVKDKYGNTPLHMAIRKNKIENIHILVDNGANINSKNNTYEHIVHVAAKYCDPNVFIKIIEMDIDIDVKDKHENTPLYYAILCQNEENIHTLLKKQADVHSKNNKSEYIIHVAARYCKLDCLMELINMNVDINVKDKQGNTPLLWAIKGKNIENVRVLLNKQSNVHAEMKKIGSVLHYSASYSDIDMLELIIMKSTNINDIDRDGNTPLQHAVRNEKVKNIQYLLDNHANVDAKNYKSKSIIHFAVECKNKKILETIIRNNVAINAQTSNGNTALHMAIQNNNVENINILLDNHADIHSKNNASEYIIHFGAKYCNPDELIKIIKAGADINAKDEKGNSPLHVAIQNKKVDNIHILLKYEADVHSKNNISEYIIHFAAKYCDPCELTKIINMGVDINAKDCYGNTPLHVASQDKKLENIHILFKNQANVHLKNEKSMYIIHHIVKYCDSNVLKSIIDMNVNVNVKDVQGNTPLHTSIMNYKIDNTLMLIENRADVRATNNKLESILHLVVKHCYEDILELILKLNVDINAKDIEGNSVLYWAIRYKVMENVNVLLDNGADVHAKNNKNVYIIHVAAKYCYSDILTRIINMKVDVNVKDDNETTPLHLAVGYYKKSNMHVLLNNQADVHAVDNVNESILHYAAAYGDVEMLETIIGMNTNINAKSSRGYTPYRMARRCSNKLNWEYIENKFPNLEEINE